MVKAFPNDPMHLFDLGWMRQFVFLWTEGPLKNRFQASEIKRINVHLKVTAKFVPREFASKCRSLNSRHPFKANEYAMWDAYIGPVLLRSADKHKRCWLAKKNFIKQKNKIILGFFSEM